MKLLSSLTTFVCSLSLLLLAGCSQSETETPAAPPSQPKQEAATPEPAPTAVAPAETPAAPASPTLQEQAKETSKQAETVMQETSLAAKETLNTAQAKAQELIDQAKALVSAENWESALEKLKGLANLELTDEQQKMVDDLKAKIQKAMESKTVQKGKEALGNLLGGDTK